MKVYKGVNKDLQGHGGFQYEIGKTYEQENPKLCLRGFHGCEAPFDVLRHYGLKDGNRYFVAELDGVTDERERDDSKRVGSKITLGSEIGFAGLLRAQIEYTREKAERGTAGGYGSNLAGGDYSNLAGGDYSNLAGGDCSNLAGGNCSNLAGGDYSNLAGGDRSNLAGGNCSNLAGGDRSNLAGGNDSNLAGGEDSLLVAGDDAKSKGGMGSVILLATREWIDGKYKIVSWKAGQIDGVNLKPDVWYRLVDGEFVEADDE